MHIKKHIPNAITCCNLFCGCLAIVKSFEGDLILAVYLVGLAAVFDFFDGFAARLLNVSSPIGKDLDSLADMVTFGVVPGIIMFQLIKNNLNKERFYLFDSYPFLIYFPFIIIIYSALRLAKFNNDVRQTESFIGLPTPANAIMICSIPLITNWNIDTNTETYQYYNFILNPYVLCIISGILSILLVSEIPLFALKFKHFKWQGNKIRFVFLGLSLIMLTILHFVAIPLIIILYILMSLINNIIKVKPSHN